MLDWVKLPAKLILTAYCNSVADNPRLAVDLDPAGIHVDLVRKLDELNNLHPASEAERLLSDGWVERRNIELTDFSVTSSQIDTAIARLGQIEWS